MEPWRCPVCHASTVFPGVATNGEGVANAFLPGGSRRWRPAGVPLSGFLACLSCGHVWSSLAPEKLRAFIEKYGRDLAKHYIEGLDSGPDRGLPGCAEARDAARGVAEIDFWVLTGCDGVAARQLRQLTNATWDQALKAVRRWHDLGRAQKLALFGWCPKEASKVHEARMPGHPVGDRWLDGE